ncbi:Polyphenol oxidase, chloroplastic [Apostasia shenzhenica]|uniref:Polyphenol oxidase, chloroplastic n=1 Tax=Apostasia shenzhenica TaxID=1088818 RepID=A0A2I0B7F7_9ASPA|nr:Polyphenol oxidase, chloroplastic [Apostasia shenzhenica]
MNNFASYRYKDCDKENPWISPLPAMVGTRLLVKPATEPTFPVILEMTAVSMAVKRPGKDGRTRMEEEVVVVVEIVEFDRNKYVKFDVFVNATEGMEMKTSAMECVGSFVSLAHLHRTGRGEMVGRTELRLGITALLNGIAATEDDEVVVTLVPRVGTVKIGGIRSILT